MSFPGGDNIGGFSIDPTTISSSNNALILRGDSGQITGSSIQLINPQTLCKGDQLGSRMLARCRLAPRGVSYHISGHIRLGFNF